MARMAFLSLFAVLAIDGSAAAAQTNREDGSKSYVVTGVVTAVSATAIVIARNGVAMMFDVDSSTRVIGRGAKPRDLLNRMWKRTIPEFVKVGDTARITYRQSGNGLTAVELRVSR
jgi:hypothetical protein